MTDPGFCPVAAAAEIVGRRWALIVVHNLMDGPLGFNELKRHIGVVSSKTLSNSLSFLSDQGIVDRKVYQNSPIRVEYSLTKKGFEMKSFLEDMKRWGEVWLSGN